MSDKHNLPEFFSQTGQHLLL